MNKLKRIVQQRYEEKSDKKIYTRQIMKLLDEHVIVGNLTKTNIVSIFDNKIFEQFIARTNVTDGDKAHQINAQILLRIMLISIMPFTKILYTYK
ncbi:hypothetical protein REIP_1023 [Rickettsia endosymbiont of Ixodes pacificus]|uniref:hypothetical protein n=1 Tax=Rickettsia endosymbiont of Ixodes pacificus TaxID=1133329 RepID=UPI00061E4F4D|nr:hypothetical protein [Rickettsia endosymbiont of Ixodes pacificus]KJW03003.1 hypothetical protein REIP_1023 [Rickettsia endosymbiont of Ixodes pacificus]